MKSCSVAFAASLFFSLLVTTPHGFAQSGTAVPAASSGTVQSEPSQPAPSQPVQPAPPAPSTMLPPAGDPVGNVATLTGSATISRFGSSSALRADDDIYMGDTLQTGADSALSVTFTDDTTFNLSANAKIVVNKYLYEDGGKKNSALFNVARGTVAFVASAVAKTGDMKITTPTATLGIRGTTGVIDVPDNVSSGNDVAIKLYPDQDGRVGHIEVTGRDGSRLGLLSQASSGFTIRSNMGRFTAMALQISPQQAARDQGFVRQVHASQGIGRQIVTRQRTLRQQNLSRQPGRQLTPGLQKQQGTPRAPGFEKQQLEKQQLQKQQLQKPQPGLPKSSPAEKRARTPQGPGQPDTARLPAAQSPPASQKPATPSPRPALQRAPRPSLPLRGAPVPKQQKPPKERH